MPAPLGSSTRKPPSGAQNLARTLHKYPERKFVPADENPLEELPSSRILLTHPSAPSAAIRKALSGGCQTSEGAH